MLDIIESFMVNLNNYTGDKRLQHNMHRTYKFHFNFKHLHLQCYNFEQMKEFAISKDKLLMAQITLVLVVKGAYSKAG